MGGGGGCLLCCVSLLCVCVMSRFVFVEFARPESVPIALQYNGAMFGDRPVK